MLGPVSEIWTVKAATVAESDHIPVPRVAPRNRVGQARQRSSLGALHVGLGGGGNRWTFYARAHLLGGRRLAWVGRAAQ